MLKKSDTIAVILGASEFPESESLDDSEIFRRSALDFKRYLTHERGIGIERDRVLDLFNSRDEAPKQLKTLIQHLDAFPDAKNVVLYYCGHGDFTDQREYSLAVYSTSAKAKNASVFRASYLRDALIRHSADKLLFVIIDACFSGAAAGIFKTMDSTEFPEPVKLFASFDQQLPSLGTGARSSLSGVVMLCAASAEEVAKAPRNAVHTMFTGALLRVLNANQAALDNAYTFASLIDCLKKEVARTYGEDAVLPRIYFPGIEEVTAFQVPYIPCIRTSSQLDPLEEVDRGQDERISELETLVEGLRAELRYLRDRLNI